MSDCMSCSPLPADVRAQLARDCVSVETIQAAAARQGNPCTRSEAVRGKEAADRHFELGCWLHYYAPRVGQSENFQDRVDCVRRCFEAGIVHPRYDFFTVFGFGERDFDNCFEMGDGDRVVDALKSIARKEPDGSVARGVRAMGWTTGSPASDAAAEVPITASTTPASVLVRFEGKVGEFASYRAASDAWCRFREDSGLGASEMPGVPEIVDPRGNPVGYISYNGRVWPGRPQDWHAGVQPLYDNRLEPMAPLDDFVDELDGGPRP